MTYIHGWHFSSFSPENVSALRRQPLTSVPASRNRLALSAAAALIVQFLDLPSRTTIVGSSMSTIAHHLKRSGSPPDFSEQPTQLTEARFTPATNAPPFSPLLFVQSTVAWTLSRAKSISSSCLFPLATVLSHTPPPQYMGSSEACVSCKLCRLSLSEAGGGPS